MQYLCSCLPGTLARIEETVSSQRIGRYLREAKGDKHRALRLYVWNSRICEAFYLPGQFLEIAIRNRLHEALTSKFGADWHRNPAFVSPLPERLKFQLHKAIQDATTNLGSAATVHHVISGLSLGFWCHLLTVRYERTLWSAGLQHLFPLLPQGVTRQDAYAKLDRFRTWRNRIAHRGAVFDKRPMKELENIKELLSWISTETLWLVGETEGVQRVIGRKPVT